MCNIWEIPLVPHSLLLPARLKVFGACEGAGTVAYVMMLGHNFP